MKAGGLCPRCAAEIDSSLTVCDDHRPGETGVCPECASSSPARIRWVCPVCKYRGSTSPAGITKYHPAAVAFQYDHGIHMGPGMNDFSVLRDNRERREEIDRDQRVLATDPVRIEVEFRAGGDELTITLNEDLVIEEVRRQIA